MKFESKIKNAPVSRFFGQIYFIQYDFVLRCRGLPYFDSPLLAGFCQYDNQKFYANQSIITSNCRERFQCHHINGTAVTKCKPLCPVKEYPKCHPYNERLTEFERPVNDTNCACTEKRCVSGIRLYEILFFQ